MIETVSVNSDWLRTAMSLLADVQNRAMRPRASSLAARSVLDWAEWEGVHYLAGFPDASFRRQINRSERHANTR